jgi:hypothetical protein
MAATSKLLMAYNGSHRSFGTCANNGWWRIHVRQRGWHSSILDLWMVADSRSSKRLAQLDSRSVDGGGFTFVGEVGTARLSFQHVFPSAYGHKLFNGSRLEGSKCNPNFQGSTFSTLFLLLMVTSSSAEVGLKTQNATQISRASLGITCNTFKAKIL